MATAQEKTTPDPSQDPTRNTDSFPPKTTPTTKGSTFTLLSLLLTLLLKSSFFM